MTPTHFLKICRQFVAFSNYEGHIFRLLPFSLRFLFCEFGRCHFNPSLLTRLLGCMFDIRFNNEREREKERKYKAAIAKKPL